jgi:2-polyprenyl-6-hydroxyphenyl methylase/3-demethylubiquinone-9 3-methyltransferase
MIGGESYAADELHCAFLAARGPLEPSRPAYKDCSVALPSDTPAEFRKTWPQFLTAYYAADKVSLMSSLYTSLDRRVATAQLGGKRVAIPLDLRQSKPRKSYRYSHRRTTMANKNTICLWYDGTAMDAARFYAETFPDSTVGAVLRAPGDYPNGKQGDVLTVEFTVIGIPCVGLNGGPEFKHNEAFSFQIATDDQAETDRLWNAIVRNGGEESQCGWCKDRWGVSWQITPRALIAALSDRDPAAAKRAFEAMMPMKKIDIAAIEAARRGR